MNEKTDVPKPRLALFLATACGLGYSPFAPGTLGSLAGLVLLVLPFFGTMVLTWTMGSFGVWGTSGRDPVLLTHVLVTTIVAVVGVWSANRAAEFWRVKDPQKVVIDEVSGQHLAILLGVALPVWWRPQAVPDFMARGSLGLITLHSVLNWKYLLVGLILFRLFDIWKPFPVRQAESLRGGWGIMADDWVAAIYAGLGLWLARAAGL